jgi:hypothetical protein
MNIPVQVQSEMELTDEQLANIAGGLGHEGHEGVGHEGVGHDDHRGWGDHDDHRGWGHHGHHRGHWVWNQWRHQWVWVPEGWW